MRSSSAHRAGSLGGDGNRYARGRARARGSGPPRCRPGHTRASARTQRIGEARTAAPVDRDPPRAAAVVVEHVAVRGQVQGERAEEAVRVGLAGGLVDREATSWRGRAGRADDGIEGPTAAGRRASRVSVRPARSDLDAPAGADEPHAPRVDPRRRARSGGSGSRHPQPVAAGLEDEQPDRSAGPARRAGRACAACRVAAGESHAGVRATSRAIQADARVGASARGGRVAAERGGGRPAVVGRRSGERHEHQREEGRRPRAPSPSLHRRDRGPARRGSRRRCGGWRPSRLVTAATLVIDPAGGAGDPDGQMKPWR